MIGILHFIIFGWPKKVKEYGPTYPITCERCNNPNFYDLVKTRRWFSLFFIPMLPLQRAQYYLACPVCDHALELERADVESMKELNGVTNRYRHGHLSEREYEEELQRVEAEVWSQAPARDGTTNSEVISSAEPTVTESGASDANAAKGQATLTDSHTTVELPDADSLSALEKESLRSVFRQFDSGAVTTKRTLTDAYEANPGGYASVDNWWDNLVMPMLERHPDIEKLDSTGRRWEFNPD